tara:strand:+ start:1666 stop:2169 length:504 start_codon:yes stop_codon:yes gene_type:complete
MEKLLQEFSIGLFFWHSIIFITLIFLLKRFAWKPILQAINDRENSIRDAIESAEKAKIEMENLKADNKKILKEAMIEKEKLLKEAKEIRQKVIDKAKDEAGEQALRIITEANETIESEKNAAIAEIKNQVVNLSIDIAEKVLKKKLENEKNQMEYVNDLVKDVNLKQ